MQQGQITHIALQAVYCSCNDAFVSDRAGVQPMGRRLLFNVSTAPAPRDPCSYMD